MFINDFENSNEYKLTQIIHTLKNVYGVELKLNESSEEDLLGLRHSSEIIKNSIVSESQFNTYNANPEYTKHTLIMEAVRLYLTEIAPKRQKKNKIKEDVVPGVQPIPPKPANTSVTADTPATPGMVKVQKGTDIKSVPAAQLAGLQTQGYKVIGDDAQAAVAETGNVEEPETGTGKPKVNMTPELEMLMKKYGIEECNLEEMPSPRARANAGRTLNNDKKHLDSKRQKSFAYPFKKKENDVTASASMEKAKADYLAKGGPVTKVPQVGGAKAPTPELMSLMKRYGVDENVADENMVENKSINMTPELEMLMKKYGVEDNVDEGFKEKLGGMMRRFRDKSYIGQKREDVAHQKANAAYAAGNKRAGDRIMRLLNKDAVDAAIAARKSLPSTRSSFKKVIPSVPATTSLSARPIRKGLTPIERPTVQFGKRKSMKFAESIEPTAQTDYQASMARAELYRNTKYAMEMMRIIRPDDEIQPWISSNLVTAADYLDQIFHYMDYSTKFEPQEIPEQNMENMSLDSPTGEVSTGGAAREKLLMIVEYSTKLFNLIHPGDKLEGWMAMKLTSASNAISNAKHYLDYIQFEKHASDHISSMAQSVIEPIDEEAPMIKKKIKEHTSVGQMLMKMMVNEDQDLAQAQTLLAAKAISDDLMSMAEKVAKMSVDDMLPLVDSMKDQFGPEAADGFNNVMKETLETLLNATTDAKTVADNAITQLQGGQIPGQTGEMGDEGGTAPPEIPGAGGIEGGEMPAAPKIPEEPLGRAKKGEGELDEAWGTKMHTPEKKKGMWDGYTLAELKSKKAKLMAKKERTAAESTKVKELNFAIRAKQKNKWGKIKESSDSTQFVTNKDKEADYDKIRSLSTPKHNIDFEHNPELAALMKKYGVNESATERGLEDNMPRIVCGVKGMKSTPFKKRFRNAAAMNKWMDSEAASNYKVEYVEKDNDRMPIKEDQDIFGERPSHKSKFSDTETACIKDFLNDKISFKDLDTGLREKLISMYGKGVSNESEMFDRLSAAYRAGEIGPNAYFESTKTLTERNKANSIKKKEIIDPKKREKEKNKFDFRNLKDKSVQDSKNKVDESAPPGKKAEDFIKGNKASFKKRYGKKGTEALYATAWKKFGKKSESVIKAGKMLESYKGLLTKLEKAFNAHKVNYKNIVKEGQIDDPLNLGYGLEGELILEQIKGVNNAITKIKEMIKTEIKQGARAMYIAEKQADKLTIIAAAKKVAPYGVAWKNKAGRSQAKFFENQSDRDYWINLKKLIEAKLINPDHFDKEIEKISSKKD